MDLIRTLHITCALLSISGFIIRGIWMMQQSNLLEKKLVKILPHIIDTLLLLTALTLAINLSVNPFEQFWLLSKIIALFVYIGLGMVALRFGKTLLQRKIALFAAIFVFIYIVLVALSKQSLPL